MSIDLTPESTLAVKLGVSLDCMRKARTDHLTEGEHFVKMGRSYYLTPAGVTHLTGLDWAEKKGGGGVVVVVSHCHGKGRYLRGRVKKSGAICTVHLVTRGVVACRFRPGDEITCTPTGELDDRYAYDGKPPFRPAP